MNERHTQLATKLAKLEERMETRQAEYRTDIARLAEGMAEFKSDLRADMAKRDAEYRADMAKRDEAISATFARLDESIADLKVATTRMGEEFSKRETRIIVTVSGLLAAWMAVLTFIA